MINNKSRKLLFIEAAMMLLLVYLFTLGVTYVLDEFRIRELDKQLQTYSLKHESFLAANSFYSTEGKKDCEFSKKYIYQEYDEIKELSLNLASFKSRILTANEQKHDIKKREFIVAQAENLNKVNNHNEICENKIFPVFFFVDGEIIGFNQQALLLQQFMINYKDELILYTIDINYAREPIINSLMEFYEVKYHNTIVLGNLSNKDEEPLGIRQMNEELNRLRGI